MRIKLNKLASPKYNRILISISNQIESIFFCHLHVYCPPVCLCQVQYKYFNDGMAWHMHVASRNCKQEVSVCKVATMQRWEVTRWLWLYTWNIAFSLIGLWYCALYQICHIQKKTKLFVNVISNKKQKHNIKPYMLTRQGLRHAVALVDIW